MARSLTQLAQISLTRVRLSLVRNSARLSSRLDSDPWFGSRGLAQLEAELVLARSLTRRSSRIGSGKSGVTPARTRVEARYSAQLCSKLGSASRLGDRFGVRVGVQLGLTRSPPDSEAPSHEESSESELGSRLNSGLGFPLGSGIG